MAGMPSANAVIWLSNSRCLRNLSFIAWVAPIPSAIPLIRPCKTVGSLGSFALETFSKNLRCSSKAETTVLLASSTSFPIAAAFSEKVLRGPLVIMSSYASINPPVAGEESSPSAEGRAAAKLPKAKSVVAFKASPPFLFQTSPVV
eukprot:Lithocolla_globosa_v1_NODE_2649_length_1920_cov_123.360858.p2 type:complete len:146 gc:universal NODE_2649_length_1920_cov_123.360858:375-812(+)